MENDGQVGEISPQLPHIDPAKAEMYKRMPQLFKPGQSGNPSGRALGTHNKSQQLNDGGLVPEAIEALEKLTRAELIALIKTVNSSIWGHAMMDDEQRAEAARLKFYHMGMTANEVHKVMPALKEWFDRTVGKAPQSMTMTVKQDPLSKAKDEDIIRLLAMMDEPLVIAPMPKMLDHED